MEDSLKQHLHKVLGDLYIRLLIAESSLGKSLDEFLRNELAELYIRVVVVEYSLEKLSKLKLQVQQELEKIKHEVCMQAMHSYHEQRQTALDFYKRKYKMEHTVECDCDHPNCAHLTKGVID
jgi:Zn-dependent M16 (insulinase) family peptidase